MHRSGTSLTSSWLQKSGLNIGVDLLGAMEGNKRGHFEDNDFLNFHKDLLEYNNSDWRVFQAVKLIWKNDHLERAKSIVAKKSDGALPWGWKDPRTCLFLSLWREAVSDAYYFVVFRNPVEVVDSLLRRRKRNLLASTQVPFWKKPKRWLQFYFTMPYYRNKFWLMWIRYNLDIIEHLDSLEDLSRVLVVEEKYLIQNNAIVISLLKKKFSLKISFVPIETVFDEKMMKKIPHLIIPKEFKMRYLQIWSSLKKKEMDTLKSYG